ncbi:MAG: hypothetical protein IPK81_15470 [Rhodospirillales bacterium]|nr:MAG: hypothetical protein IPK81_15470 [Rhodospirillales bacterium]
MPDPTTIAARLPLRPAQLAALAALGVAFWLAGALTCRVLGPMGVYEGLARIVLYALVVPGTVPLILVARRAAKLEPDRIALGVAVMTAVATLLDGVALAWFPALYGADLPQVAGAGAVILWGGGVGLALGCVMNRTTRS